MADPTVLTEIAGRIAIVTINRPEKLNALNTPVRTALVAALDALEQNRDVRAVILTGAGAKAFVAGAGNAEFAEKTPVDQYRIMRARPGYGAADRVPQPLNAAINGFCLGGGGELARACEIRIATEGAKFGQPEINLGILPGGGGTQRLPRLVGLGQAFRLLYTGDLIEAPEALRIGLVDEVVPAADLMPRARALAEKIAGKSPVALSLIKEAVRSSMRMPLDEGLRHEATLFGLVFSSDDKREGVAAFLGKRTPEFTGR